MLGFPLQGPRDKKQVSALPTGQPVSQPYTRVRRLHHAPKHRHQLALHSCFEVLPGTVGHHCQQIRAIVFHHSPLFLPINSPFLYPGNMILHHPIPLQTPALLQPACAHHRRCPSWGSPCWLYRKCAHIQPCKLPSHPPSSPKYFYFVSVCLYWNGALRKTTVTVVSIRPSTKNGSYSPIVAEMSSPCTPQLVPGAAMHSSGHPNTRAQAGGLFGWSPGTRVT